MIGAMGGTVQSAGASVTIPPGALDQPVLITVHTVASGFPPLGAAPLTVYAFEPHFQSFNAQVQVSLPVSGAGQFQLYQAHPGDMTWAVGTVSRVGDFLQFGVSHFTFFAAALGGGPCGLPGTAGRSGT